MDDLRTMRRRCEDRLKTARMRGDKGLIGKLEKIREFLQKDDCFVDADEIIATYNMLLLGYDFDEAAEVYDHFNRIPAYQGYLEYTSESGNVIRKKAVLRPDVEDYYRFDTGCIFKFDSKEQDFYALRDGTWVYDGELQRMFFDSSYGYERVRYRIEEELHQAK